jgi:hypothetical protein
MQNHIFSLAANKESHPRLVRCGHGECGQFSAACPAGGGTADAPPAQTAPAPLQMQKSQILFGSEQSIQPSAPSS